MKLDRQKQLLDYLAQKPNLWVNAQKIADLMGISTRQIRKYIVAINAKCNDFDLIQSGPKGYYLDNEKLFIYKEMEKAETADTPQTRQSYLIQKLFAFSQGYSVFDLADELFVSLPTIESDLATIRKKLEDYQLTLRRSKDSVFIEGEEIAKRTLMRNLILPDHYDHFALKDEIQLLASRYCFWELRKNVREILMLGKDIFVNDYTLNDIVLHIIVMADRIRNGGTLKQKDLSANPFEQTAQYATAVRLAAYISETYHVPMNEPEIYFLMVILYNNTTVVDFNSVDLGNINRYIEQKYIDFTKNTLGKVERVYYLDPFNNTFITRFIVHINNMLYRLKEGYHIRNPLKSKIKTAFPLIYDMAVFIAQEFKSEYDIHLTEDEITFIALHLGGYFENNLNQKNKVTCIFVYTDYHDTYKGIIEKISRTFTDVLTIKYVVSLEQYKTEGIEADIIISAADLDFNDRNIIIHPFLKETDIENIRNAITYIMQKNRFNALKAYLLNFIDSGLFYKNPAFSNKTDAIIAMTQNAIRCGYADDNLTESVLQREALSDTAFGDVAVPHSLQDGVTKSFISFAISDTSINWENKQVHIIILIGVNKDSRKVFTEIFDLLIDILSNSKNVKELASATDFKDFYQKLIAQIEMIG